MHQTSLHCPTLDGVVCDKYINLCMNLAEFADYVRLLKYGDSLYRCKELKRAALVRTLRQCSLCCQQYSSLSRVLHELPSDFAASAAIDKAWV